MKKLLVCLMICVLASVAFLKIEGVAVPKYITADLPEYDGSDVFVITVGDEEESTYIIMKDSSVLKIETLTEEQLENFLNRQSL